MLVLAGCGTTKEAASLPAAQAEASPVPDPPADTRPVIVAFGDSLTAGYGLDAGQSFPDELQKLLDNNGYRYRVVNQGISGDTTSGGVARMSQAIELKPEVVILELGGNDGLRGLPVAMTAANLDKMTEAFQAAGAKVLLAGLTLPRNYGADYIHGFEEIYPTIERKRHAARIRFLLEGVAMVPGMMQADQIHPTAAGAKIVAATVFAALKPLLHK